MHDLPLAARAGLLALTIALAAGCASSPFQSASQAQARPGLAAEQGDASAQFNLGVMYDNGEGVPQDHQQAVAWYRKAAEQGYASAQFNLGNMYLNGRGVPQDHQQAVIWYRKAAEQGEASAQYNLGHMYANGEGVPQNYSLAYTWVSVAIARGVQNQSGAIGVRNALAAKLSPPQLAEAQKRATQYFEQYQPRN